MVEVILTKHVSSLGTAGDVVRVRPGYARNYLLPRGIALVATRNNVAQLEHQKRRIAAEQEKLKEEYQRLAKEVEGASVSIELKKGDGDRLFGSVTAKDIAGSLQAQKIEVDRRTVELSEPIRTEGDHEVEIRFSADVKATLKVTVVGVA